MALGRNGKEIVTRTEIATRGGLVAENLPAVNIVGMPITWDLYRYSYSLIYNTARGADTTEERENITLPVDVKRVYKKIQIAQTETEKQTALKERVNQILIQVNYIGYRFNAAGVAVQNKDFWQTATPFLVNAFFVGGGLLVGGANGAKLGLGLGNMVTGYAKAKETEKLKSLKVNASQELKNLDIEAKALSEILTVQNDTLQRSANTNNIIKVLGLGAAAFLGVKAIRKNQNKTNRK
jgi:hypothetical protein